MFEKENRYITRAVLDVLTIEINLLLYDLIDELTIEKDYLQIFELNPIGKGIVEVIHKQEAPKYEAGLLGVVLKNTKSKQSNDIIEVDYEECAIGNE